MLCRCAEVLGKTGSCCGKYDCALLLMAAQFLAHPLTRALEDSAEYNSFASLIHCLLQDVSCLVVDTESSLDKKFISAFPLSGFGAFSFDADPYRL